MVAKSRTEKWLCDNENVSPTNQVCRTKAIGGGYNAATDIIRGFD